MELVGSALDIRPRKLVGAFRSSGEEQRQDWDLRGEGPSGGHAGTVSWLQSSSLAGTGSTVAPLVLEDALTLPQAPPAPPLPGILSFPSVV